MFPPQAARAPSDAPPLLEVRNLSWTDRLNDISLQLHAGEVVGLGGLDGQGQRELLLALFGVLRGTTGEVLIDGKPRGDHGPATSRSASTIGMALIPEDRKTEGLMLPMSVRDNLSFAALGRVVALAASSTRAAERAAVERMIRLLAIRTDGTDVPAGSLSGGNQQKLVIGKWLMMRAAHHPAQRSDARHRRRHQAGDVSAAAQARRRRRRDPLLFDRL